MNQRVEFPSEMVRVSIKNHVIVIFITKEKKKTSKRGCRTQVYNHTILLPYGLIS